jgi:citrate (Re)-synthase
MIYKAIDTLRPNLFKEQFPYEQIPKVKFNNIQFPMNIPEDIWITDTTFRDGQQSMESMTVEEIVDIYDYLNKLDNGSGIIRQTEFFLYSEKDREAIKECMKRGYKFPQITSWIRAKEEDFELVKSMNIRETGILMSCSDYHIFHKLGMNRKEAMESYLNIAEAALKNGITPRCHFEDITRADFFGFVAPLAKSLMELSSKYEMKVKIRACDTLGVGVCHVGVELPRSIPAIIHGLRYYCNVPASSIEWHGHNDFNSVVVNSTTSWLYGGSAVNATLFGIGERTGNCPLESMIFEYAQIKGNTKDMNLKIISDIRDYFEKKLGVNIHTKMPFVGDDFNVTKAGIHADGMLKNKEIYNSFDTERILNRPPLIVVNSYSGLAGIAAWINAYFKLSDIEKIGKNDKRIIPIKGWVDEEYKNGRTSNIKNEELKELVERFIPTISSVKKEKVI